MENSTKYKVGDKVRIKSKDWYNKNKGENGSITFINGIYFLPKMEFLCGEIVTIKRIDPYDESYDIKESVYSIVDDMIECKVGEETPAEESVSSLFKKIQKEFDEFMQSTNVLIADFKAQQTFIEPTKSKYEFKPFDKVVARTGKGNFAWNVDFFSHIINPFYDNGINYFCIGGIYSQCLPFNDRTAKLIGTTDDYEEEQQ